MMEKTKIEVLQRLGPVPFWRGEEKFMPALENIYRKAMTKAREALNRENSRAGEAAKRA